MERISDHHFKPLNEYEYTLEFVEPRKTDLETLYSELKEREKYLDSAVILEDYNVFAVNGMKKENSMMLDRIKEMMSNSEGPEMVYNVFISKLKNKLTEFYKGLLIDEDLEDLLNKLDYNRLIGMKNVYPDDIINSCLVWGNMKKGVKYWNEIYTNMNIEKTIDF